MKSLLDLSILAVCFLLISGCEEDGGTNPDKITGTGPLVTKALQLDFFYKIENNGVANFYIIAGSPQSVQLTAQQNIIDVMTFEVTDETLHVGFKKDVSVENHEEIRFDITLPALTGIGLTGVGDFVLSGEDQDQLTIRLTGVGNVKAFDMKVRSCTITSTGVGNCEVYVTDNLRVTISGVGNVYYRGKPSIISHITGLGLLIDSN